MGYGLTPEKSEGRRLAAVTDKQEENAELRIVCALLSFRVASDPSSACGLQPSRLLCPWGFSRKEYWSGLPWTLQGIFPTQGSNPGLPHCRKILYHLSHQGSPRMLEWAAYPFFRGSSQTSNSTMVSFLAGGFFTSWATREAQEESRLPEFAMTKDTWVLPLDGHRESPSQEPI